MDSVHHNDLTAHTHLVVNVSDDIVRSTNTPVGCRVSKDVSGAVHPDATGHAHPVGEWRADVFITTAAILAAVSTVNTATFIVSGAEDVGPLIDDLFLNAVSSSRSPLTSLPGAYGGIDCDFLLRADQELGTLVREIDTNRGVLRSGGTVDLFIPINFAGLGVVRTRFKRRVRYGFWAGDKRTAGKCCCNGGCEGEDEVFHGGVGIVIC